MKWSSVKNIMIGFLIFMNLFMIAIIAVTTLSKTYIPQDVLNANISVIRKAGFEIQEDIFPSKYYTLPDYKAQFYTASDLSELFFKKQIAFRTEGDNLVGTEDKKTLTVNDNFFSFDSGHSPDEGASQKKIKRALERAGFDMTGAVFDAGTMHFYKMYNGLNLFNMSLEAKLDNSGDICYVKAHWPKSLIKGENNTISFIESSAKLKDIFFERGAIKSIELGYSLHSVGGDNYVFSPAWRVNVNEELKIVE